MADGLNLLVALVYSSNNPNFLLTSVKELVREIHFDLLGGRSSLLSDNLLGLLN